MVFMKKITNFEKAREKFIAGAAPEEEAVVNKNENEKEWTRILLRIRVDAITQIDSLIKDRMAMTRTSWILQVIEDRIKEELNKSKLKGLKKLA